MTQQREHWGSRLGFIMATAGSAIGLGSLWRFPYIVGQNGGGAFVLLYLIFTFGIGIPIFIAELIIGRSSQKSAIKAFTELAPKSNHWKILGWFNILTSFIILSYYSVISGWTVNYALMSLVQFYKGKTPEQISNIFDILSSSSDINLFWHFIFMLMTVGVVFKGIRKGIEYWSRILTPALLVILIGLFLFSTTLSGFKESVEFILLPNFSSLTSSGVLDALGMALFTISVGIGIVLTYGSYMKPSEDIPKTGLIIGTVSVSVSLFAALMIFPIIFSFGFEPQAGPGLVFKTLPVLFAQLPGSLVISTIFFILFVFTALTSSISLLEVLSANLIEVFGWKRAKAVSIAGLATFVMGIPTALASSGALFGNWIKIYGMNFFDTINEISGSWMMPLGGLFTIIFAGWFMEKKLVQSEFTNGTTLKRLLKPWFFTIRYVAPLAVLIVILQRSEIIDLTVILDKLFTK
ncbi:MAG TPA: sodium-dependent transporter [Chlamydiales bacterium]|nr:sodium-dependent transporter [Chlamydiales bacterium]